MMQLKKVRKSIGLVLLFVFCVGIPVAIATEYFKQTKSRFGATAGESISAGDTVYISISDGKAYKGDADTEATCLIVGIAGNSVSSSSYVTVVTEGILAGQTSATPGYRLFSSSTAGGIDVGVLLGMNNTFSQSLGFVLPPLAGGTSSTDYYIRVSYNPSPGAGYTY